MEERMEGNSKQNLITDSKCTVNLPDDIKDTFVDDINQIPVDEIKQIPNDETKDIPDDDIENPFKDLDLESSSNNSEHENSPENSDTDEVKETQKFVDDCKALHIHIFMHDIKLNDRFEKIKEILRKYPNSRYFYNPRNVSAAAYACSCEKFDIYELLLEHRVCIGPHEDVDRIFSDLLIKKQEILKEIHDKLVIKLPDHHLAVLIANSYVGHDEFEAAERKQHVVEAFEFLNQIPQTKILLEVVAAVKNFAVMFDFYRTSVQHMAPDNGPGANGVFYISKQIYVAAMEMLEEILNFKVPGVLSHELCHFAMLLVFGNHSIPFPIGDIKTRRKFMKIFKKCKKSRSKDEIIKNVFDSYKDETVEVQFAELIVRVPQMSATYNGNEEKLKQVREDFKELFDFYENIVMPQMEKALPMLKKLAENPDEVEWKDLTPEMQMTIENSEIINFQGVATNLKELNIQNDSKFFNNLNSEDIHEIIKGNGIKIGVKINTEMNFYIRRKFEKVNNSSSNENEPKIIIKSFQELAESDEDVILLSDTPGCGKSATFKNCALKMKKIFPKKWISCVDLKQHKETFDEWNKMKDDWTMQKLREFFSKIFNLNSLEIEILSQFLTSTDMFIIFWDGLDEVSPHFNEFMIKMLSALRDLVKCKQWISTRPQHKIELENVFDIKAYSLREFNDIDRKKFLEKYVFQKYKSKELTDENLKIVQEFLESLKSGKSSFKIEEYDVTNPLFLQMIAEVQLNLNSTNESLTSISLCSLYVKFIKMKLDILDDKGFCTNEDQKAILMNSTLNLMEIHQYYAMREMFPPKYDDLDSIGRIEVSILKISKKEITWKSEQISRNGLITFTSNQKSNFIHRTFAEFFVAQYIFDNVHNAQDEPQANEGKMRLKLLFVMIFDRGERYQLVRDFIMNFVETSKSKAKIDNFIGHCFKSINREYLNYLIENDVHYILSEEKLIYLVDFISKFFQKDEQLIKSFWRIDDDESLLLRLLKCELLRKIPRLEFKRYENFKKLSQKFFPPEIVDFSCQQQKQKAIVMYDIWIERNLRDIPYINSRLSEVFNFQIENEIIASLEQQKTFSEFFKNLKLTQDDQREFFLQNSHDILSKSLGNFNELSEIFTIIEGLFSKCKKDSKLITQMLIDNAGVIFLEIKGQPDVNVVKLLLEKHEKYVKKENAMKLFSANKTSTSIFKIITEISTNNVEVLNEFLNYIDANLNDDQIVKILKQSTELGWKNFTFLHHALANVNENLLEIIERFYLKYFELNEIQEILIENFVDFMQFLYKKSTRKCIEKIVKFIERTFSNDEDGSKLRELLTQQKLKK